MKKIAIVTFSFIMLATLNPAMAQQPETPPVPAPNAATAPTTELTPAMPRSVNRIDEALSKLPPAKAQIFNEVMKRNADANRATQTQLRATYASLRENFVGATFNKEEFLARSTQARELQSALRASLDNDLAEVISTLTQEERIIIFGALPTRYTRDMEER